MMDRNLCLALLLSATFQCLAQTPEPMEVRRAEPLFEELPELKASEILKPELLKGPHFAVRDPVPTNVGMNQFTIDSDFGVFEADGNEMLLQRLKAISNVPKGLMKFLGRAKESVQNVGKGGGGGDIGDGSRMKDAIGYSDKKR